MAKKFRNVKLYKKARYNKLFKRKLKKIKNDLMSEVLSRLDLIQNQMSLMYKSMEKMSKREYDSANFTNSTFTRITEFEESSLSNLVFTSDNTTTDENPQFQLKSKFNHYRQIPNDSECSIEQLRSKNLIDDFKYNCHSTPRACNY
ncbi:unnamed protein product [Brachionus calyciflorus]|uniref:Uncharacterized protein n=1 Tax=Brachionus calyciflorus TaxID=104777 RepID=A0A813XE68_9BILA|nr:unnamed protein product [Brachionus calyciflorus]